MTRTRFTLVLVLALTACIPGRTEAPNWEVPSSPSPLAAGSYTAPSLPIAAGIRVPDPFAAYVYAQGLKRPTAVAVGPDRRLYAIEEEGRVVVVPGPGRSPEVLAQDLLTPLGMAWRGDDLFVAARGYIVSYRLDGGRLSGGQRVVQGLPVGRYQNDNILFLPTGDILVGVGSTCDSCREKDERSATVLRYHKDWSYAGVVMKGVRNPFGIALRRATGAAYVTINAQDFLGPNEPADHLVRVVPGGDAGWPRCWPSWEKRNLHGDCGGVARPIAFFEPHASADGFVFYEYNGFPAEYRGNAFVAEWGAVSPATTIGRKVVRVTFTGSKDNEQGTVTDFATGFDRPLAITVGPDGGLLVADFGSGQIIEIAPR